MHGRTDFAHGHSSEKIISGGFWKQARSFGLNHHLRTFAFAGSKYNGVLRDGVGMGATAAMSGPLETELAGTKSRAQQQNRCCADNRQRNQLLPIHGRKII
jgi:hypothetical protein